MTQLVRVLIETQNSIDNTRQRLLKQDLDLENHLDDVV